LDGHAAIILKQAGRCGGNDSNGGVR
jgi:hypothetical protein